MRKNIIICCDGTANELDEPNRTSNVMQLFCHLKDIDSQRQVAYYDPGVGTRGYSFLDGWDQITGWTVDENVKQAYEFLMNFYEAGDRIYLFGFSRGAYTVRVLTGLLAKCGILHKRNTNLIDYAFKIFRRRNNEGQAKNFRDILSRTVDVHFLGVWDTVSTVLRKGYLSPLPDYFRDTILSSQVRYACQALSIDDRRRSLFNPIRWSPPEGLDRMEQVWFAGAHSDVGGGYQSDPDTKRRMANLTLRWMMKRAYGHGLLLNDFTDLEGIARLDDALATLHWPHRRMPWKLFPFLNGSRTIPAAEATRDQTQLLYPRLHESVLYRLHHPTTKYQPGNLPAEYDVVDDAGRVLSQVRVNRPSVPLAEV
ncbi:hypothetical protein BWI93_15055 [Siphonobacter sp. BAB-5385]|uniref:DUF2235 domain-containing protein n=1 Tax=Siphonobacter sp. BAB-5385 TaxID=1864822 RepID=UPI000B9E31A6|nr:DUF2235 domain-containing protein [Siphonobacter sp. BAB-5385]OZI07345.1 hypothetical protein BWI93_15055 [Siphonobacter sp. BAB-5385]